MKKNHFLLLKKYKVPSSGFVTKNESWAATHPSMQLSSILGAQVCALHSDFWQRNLYFSMRAGPAR